MRCDRKSIKKIYNYKIKGFLCQNWFQVIMQKKLVNLIQPLPINNVNSLQDFQILKLSTFSGNEVVSHRAKLPLVETTRCRIFVNTFSTVKNKNSKMLLDSKIVYTKIKCLKIIKSAKKRCFFQIYIMIRSLIILFNKEILKLLALRFSSHNCIVVII